MGPSKTKKVPPTTPVARGSPMSTATSTSTSTSAKTGYYFYLIFRRPNGAEKSSPGFGQDSRHPLMVEAGDNDVDIMIGRETYQGQYDPKFPIAWYFECPNDVDISWLVPYVKVYSLQLQSTILGDASGLYGLDKYVPEVPYPYTKGPWSLGRLRLKAGRATLMLNGTLTVQFKNDKNEVTLEGNATLQNARYYINVIDPRL